MGLDMYLIKRKKDKKVEINDDLWDFKDELIYWRKANMIHKFFCDNGKEIQEQCSYKISKENIETLIKKCEEVLEKVKIEKGKIINGYTYENGEKKPILEDGEIITNVNEIADILPTQCGFFFGSTEYDNYYIDDIKYTLEKLKTIKDYIDYDNEDVYYLASW